MPFSQIIPVLIKFHHWSVSPWTLISCKQREILNGILIFCTFEVMPVNYILGTIYCYDFSSCMQIRHGIVLFSMACPEWPVVHRKIFNYPFLTFVLVCMWTIYSCVENNKISFILLMAICKLGSLKCLRSYVYNFSSL